MDATSTSSRLTLAAAWLISANILAGAFADRLDYPGLAATGTVFSDYALPLTLSWSLVHWVTLVPIAAVMFGLPLWDERRVILVRCVLFAGIVTCVTVELVYGGGNWHGLPFLVFALVDCAVGLMVALTFHPPLRLLIAGGAVAVVAGGVFLATHDSGASPGLGHVVESGVTDETLLAPETVSGRLVKVWTPKGGPDTTVFLEVLPQVEPDKAPDPVNICGAARGVFEAELRKRRVHPRDARVEFKVHPTFDPRLKYLYPGGIARFRSSQFWECRFQYPDPGMKI